MKSASLPYLLKYFIWAFILIAACSRIPEDPQHSFDKAKASGLKVGVVVNPPFTIIQDGQPAGTEITLIENFARQNALTINYVIASESQLIVKLEKYQLHLIAGGFDKKTTWITKAGLTTPYDQEHVFLIPKGENKLLYKLEHHILRMQDETAKL